MVKLFGNYGIEISFPEKRNWFHKHNTKILKYTYFISLFYLTTTFSSVKIKSINLIIGPIKLAFGKYTACNTD